MKTKRVGSITCGLVLILFGILFFVHMFVPGLSYEVIFHLWPLILILLGIEILAANAKAADQVFKYDVGAVFMILALAVFAMVMGGMDFWIQNGGCSVWY